MKKYKILTIIICLMITLSLTACNSPSKKKERSPEELLDLYVEAMEKGKYENVEKVVPKFYLDANNFSRESFDKGLKAARDEFGDDIKVTYEIKEKRKMDDSEIKKANEYLSQFDNYKEVTECYELDGTITYSSSKFTDPDPLGMSYCKIEGQWYLIF